MNKRDRIIKELNTQKSIEGNTPQTALVRKVLDQVKTSQQWQTLVTIRYHRYGTLSYESHRFYYPSEVLLNLERMFTEDQDWQAQS